MSDLKFGDKVTVCLANDRHHAVVTWVSDTGRLAEVMTSFDEESTEYRLRDGEWRTVGARLAIGWIGEHRNPDV